MKNILRLLNRTLPTATCLVILSVFAFVNLEANNFSYESSEELLLNNSLISKNTRKDKKPQNTKAVQSTNRWKPYFTRMCNVQGPNMRYFTQFNIGIGFLYFAGFRGNCDLTARSAPSPIAKALTDIDHLAYNRVPLYEYILGYRVFNWFKAAVSIQNQQSVSINSNFSGVSSDAQPDISMHAHLNFNAIMLKLYFELPYPMIIKRAAFSPYLAAGVGPGWISATDVTVWQESDDASVLANIRAKYSANASWMLDVGVRARGASPRSMLSIVAGCKYNEWGQIRNVGKKSQMGDYHTWMNHPFGVKVVYSFAPYLGAQFNF